MLLVASGLFAMFFFNTLFLQNVLGYDTLAGYLALGLALLGVPEAEWDAYLSATLLALRGWGGMVRQVEQRFARTMEPPAGVASPAAASNGATRVGTSKGPRPRARA